MTATPVRTRLRRRVATGDAVAVGACFLALVGTGWPAPTYASTARGPSSTSIVLSTSASVYGQPVRASATVTAAPGEPQGDIFFAVDGLQLKANLPAGGTATIVLPKLPVGQYPVSATYVPQFPDEQQGSTSPALAWVVSQVRTRLQVRVIGRGARIPTSVEVRAAGDFGTRPTGRVKVVVQRRGGSDVTRVVRRLSTAGVVLAELGKLRQGRYRLRVTYVGDSQHLREVSVERFSVRRR